MQSSTGLSTPTLERLLKSILDDDRSKARRLIKQEPGLAVWGVGTARLYESKIFHWMYVNDTALHLAAAGYRVEIAKMLLAAGADANAAGNHRKGRPLHYAADGYIQGKWFDAARQVKMIRCLLEHGANLQAVDKNGATPLHRAVRTRCADAVECLLRAGASAVAKNRSGSTPFDLAEKNTGRGGSGSDKAKAQQRRIIELLKDGAKRR